MLHCFHCKSLFFRFNNILDFRIHSLPNPLQKPHPQTNPPSSLVQCLQTSLGISQEMALTLSRKLKFRNRFRKPSSPNSVLTFFKSNGLSEAHIKSMINKAPLLLFYSSPESRLRPKIQFFRDKDISESDLVDLMLSNPHLFTRSVERHIEPVFNFLRSVLGTDELAVQWLTKSKLRVNLRILSTNITTLRNCGVQNRHISKLFLNQPRPLNRRCDSFKEVLETVKGMGFKPRSYAFVRAVFVILGTKRQTWDAKFKVYTSLGWSAEETLLVFRRHPPCMLLSKEKIKRSFHYLAKELGWDPSRISSYPTLLSLSLEKRLIPRHKFLQFLVSKGFIKKDKNIANSFWISEEGFLKNFVTKYESEVPDILEIYGGLMGSKLLNNGDGKD